MSRCHPGGLQRPRCPASSCVLHWGQDLCGRLIKKNRARPRIWVRGPIVGFSTGVRMRAAASTVKGTPELKPGTCWSALSHSNHWAICTLQCLWVSRHSTRIEKMRDRRAKKKCMTCKGPRHCADWFEVTPTVRVYSLNAATDRSLRRRHPSPSLHLLNKGVATTTAPVGARAENLRIRGPTPCPLGQGLLLCQ